MKKNAEQILSRGIKPLKRNLRKFYQRGHQSFPQMKKEYRKRFKMSLNQWLLYHQRNIHYDKCYWMGVRALKNPFDAWIYQEIIYEVKADVI